MSSSHSAPSVSHKISRAAVLLSLGVAFGTHSADVQGSSHDPRSRAADSVVQRIYTEGMQHSHAAGLAQVLLDSIGPRLTGSPANRAANAWLLRTYTAWGIPAHNERYGTWRDWMRGPSRLELVAPRGRTLEATVLAWSPATPPGGVTADVVALPQASDAPDSVAFARWLATVRGKFVLFSAPQLSCRPDTSWASFALPETYQAMRAARDSARAEWRNRMAGAGVLGAQLEAAGVAGILTSRWSGGWGVDMIMDTKTTTTPVFDVSCEDYSLLARLAEHGQHPRVHAVADVRPAPTEAPVYNTIAELKGTEHPEQYVMLSAHIDSWDAASGATDNGTGTIVMLEAMRLLKLAYPHPKRTILVGHWSGEEEGDLGSNAFAEDHPEILRGLQALFNEDDGTGRITNITSIGLVEGPAALTRWMSQLPTSLTSGIRHNEPGAAKHQGSDSDAFACRETPAFDVGQVEWDGDYTYHSNRDTFDKLSFDDIERNATLFALLAYEASEDPQQLSRTRQGHYGCSPAPRSWKAAKAAHGK